MTSLPGFILDALSNPIGHVRDYSNHVVALQRALEARMDTAFRLDTEMNYNPAQSLTSTLRGRDALRKRYEFDLRFYLSSKAPLFAVFCFDRRSGMTDRGGVNYPIARERLPDAVGAWIDRAKAVLAAHGLAEVEHRYFHVPAPGRSTQLDGLPATVVESLFVEIV